MPIEAFPTVSAKQLRKRSVGNLLRMGHCAPTVMQTMLDASDTEAKWLVLLMAGLPGGIGNTGGECGGLTAPLMLMGLRHGRDETVDGLPLVVDPGHDLLQRFTTRCGTTHCRQILGNARVPLRCIGVVQRAPAMCAQCIAASPEHVIAAEHRAGLPRVVRALAAARLSLRGHRARRTRHGKRAARLTAPPRRSWAAPCLRA